MDWQFRIVLRITTHSRRVEAYVGLERGSCIRILNSCKHVETMYARGNHISTWKQGYLWHSLFQALLLITGC